MCVCVCVCVCVCIHYNMDESRGYYAKGNRSKINTISYVTSKSQNKENNGNTHMENKLLVSRRMEVKGGIKMSEWV